jgi:hypothetical protein
MRATVTGSPECSTTMLSASCIDPRADNRRSWFNPSVAAAWRAHLAGNFFRAARTESIGLQKSSAERRPRHQTASRTGCDRDGLSAQIIVERVRPISDATSVFAARLEILQQAGNRFGKTSGVGNLSNRAVVVAVSSAPSAASGTPVPPPAPWPAARRLHARSSTPRAFRRLRFA